MSETRELTCVDLLRGAEASMWVDRMGNIAWHESPNDLGYEHRCYCDAPEACVDLGDGDWSCCRDLDCECDQSMREDRICEESTRRGVAGSMRWTWHLCCRCADELDVLASHDELAERQIAAAAIREREGIARLHKMREGRFGTTDPVKALVYAVTGRAA